MTWNTSWPNGAVSVKANKTPGQQNTSYIENTMNNDHYWNIGANQDGRHKYMNMPVQASDPSISTGMDGIIYLKSDGSRVEGYYRNNEGIYQFIPAFLSGTASITSSSVYVTVVAVPANVYGEIFMYTTATGKYSAVTGFFRSDGSKVESWALTNHAQGTGDAVAALKFGNGSEASGLNIRARLDDGSSGTYNYRITYRAL